MKELSQSIGFNDPCHKKTRRSVGRNSALRLIYAYYF